MQEILSSLQLGGHRSTSTAHTWDPGPTWLLLSHLCCRSLCPGAVQVEMGAMQNLLTSWGPLQPHLSHKSTGKGMEQLQKKVQFTLMRAGPSFRHQLAPGLGLTMSTGWNECIPLPWNTGGHLGHTPSVSMLAYLLPSTVSLKHFLLGKGEPLAEKQIRAESCMVAEGPWFPLRVPGIPTLCPAIFDSLSWLRARLTARGKSRNHRALETAPGRMLRRFQLTSALFVGINVAFPPRQHSPGNLF